MDPVTLGAAKAYADELALGGAVPIPGPSGAPGKSAYQIWLDDGNAGSPQDFLASLAGKDGAGVPAGGTTGQVLVKASDNDRDTLWTTPPGGSGGISDAPANGALYGRKNNAWETVPTGGGYTPPTGGIPRSDLAQSVQDSLGAADSALQSFTETDPAFTLALPTLALKTEIPENISSLTNDSGFITAADLPNVSGLVTQTEVDSSVAAHNTGNSAHADIRSGIDDALDEAKAYTDGQVSGAVTATQFWLPAVAEFADLPMPPSDTRSYLCRVNSQNNVYQHVPGDEWRLYSANTDFINEDQMKEEVSLHDGNHLAHGDIRGKIYEVEGILDKLQSIPKHITSAELNSYGTMHEWAASVDAGTYFMDATPNDITLPDAQGLTQDEWNIIVVDGSARDPSFDSHGIVTVICTTANKPICYRTWHASGWTRPWTELGGIDDADTISRVYLEVVDSMHTRIDALQPGGTVRELVIHDPFGAVNGGQIIFENGYVEFQSYGGVVSYVDDRTGESVVIRSFSDVFVTRVAVNDVFVEATGDWDDMFYAVLSTSPSTVKRWDNEQLFEAIRNIDPETSGNTFTTVPDYANMEATEKLTTAANSSWTVDRDGFVYLYMRMTNGGAGAILINGARVFQSFTSAATVPAVHNNVLPVKAGDVITQLHYTGTAEAVQCLFIPPRIVWASTPATEFNARIIGQPDWENRERVNRIPNNSGTWTVERDGYVNVGSEATNVLWATTTALVNDILAWSNAGTAPHDGFNRGLIPVSAGDVVRIEVYASINPGGNIVPNCYFVPPKTVAPMFVTESDLQSSHLPGEVMIDPVTKAMRVNDPVNTFTAVPDIDNYDPVNKMSASNMTWTADRDGFVRCSYSPDVAGVGWQFTKNGVAFSLATAAVNGGLRESWIDVKAGDVIAINQGGVSAAHYWSRDPFAIRPPSEMTTATTSLWSGCYFVPKKIVWATSDAAQFHTRLIGQPDFANQETINRFTIANPTWTADRDGYVHVSGSLNTPGYTVTVNVNTKQAAAIAQWGAVTIPISKGDVVGITISGGSLSYAICNFIPPISVTPIALTGVDMVSSTERGKINIDPVNKTATINGWDGGGGGNPETITMHSTEETGGTAQWQFSREYIKNLPPDGGIPDDIVISADNYMYQVNTATATLNTTLLRQVGSQIGEANTDVTASYWHSSRVLIALNDQLYSMTGQERFELSFFDVQNSAGIDLTSHIALTEKLFVPIDELFGTDPGDMFDMLDGPIRRIEAYCHQYGEFDMDNVYDWDVYNDVDELLNSLNMIDMIDPQLMSLKMDFKYTTENGMDLTVMPMGISGSKGANEIIVPYIRNKESVS